MIKIIRHAIPNTNPSSGDTFSLSLYRGYMFMCIEVINDTPYATFLEDDTKDMVTSDFEYANSSQTFSEGASYLGKYTTLIPAKSFYIFEVYNV